VRLTVTSPDGLGDFILRLPWLLTMEQQGWDLQLVAREPTLELARLAGLHATGVEIANSPYSRITRTMKRPFTQEFRRIREFRPDILFFGPSQISFFEEQAASELDGMTKGGFRVDTDFQPGEGIEDPLAVSSAYDFHVTVESSDPEPLRNAKAARFLLGNPTLAVPEPFRFPATFADRTRPEDSAFVAVSAGHRAGDRFAGWGNANWSRELGALAHEAKQPYVFVGIEKEQESHAAIMKNLPHDLPHRDLTGKLGKVEDLLRVLSGTTAYVGKDGGVMHLAAALGKPVLAVFGGGHWPRFLPAGGKSVVLTVNVPCRGCDWRCHLDQPACVTDLAEGSLVEGWRNLQRIGADGCLVLEQQPRDDTTGRFDSSLIRDFPRQDLSRQRAARRNERTQALKPFYLRWAARRPHKHV